MDDVDWKIVEELQRDARQGFRELGRTIELSPQAVAVRVRRLERTGVITGYSARVDPSKLGYAVQAWVVVTTGGVSQSRAVAAKARAHEAVLEDHRITGTEDHLLRVVATDLAALEPLIDELNAWGKPATSLVLSSPKPWAPVPRPTPPD